MHPVLDVRARDQRRPLRPERQRATAAVVERVHLLDDVGRLPDAAREQLRASKSASSTGNRGLEDLLGLPLEHVAAGSISGSTSNVPRGPRSLVLRELSQESVRGALASERRQRPCPGYTIACSGNVWTSVSIDFSSVASRPPVVDATDRTLEQHVAENSASSPRIAYVTCPGLWPGVEADVDRQAGEFERLAADDRLVAS